MNYSLVIHTLVENDLSETYNWYENKQTDWVSVF